MNRNHFVNTTRCALLLLTTTLAAQTPDAEHVRDNVFAQMTWRELGPVTSGGRIVDIAVHPERKQVFWAAAASGGIWKTENGGLSWTAQFQDAYSISIGDLAVAPSNGDVLYIGTGEANNQRSSYWGDGVYKSTDGGASWSHIGLRGTDHIGRIVVHPSNPDIVFVAALGALYRSNDERGLYRSQDGGASWTRVKHCGPDTGFVDVAMDPDDPNTIFAASYERRRRAWNFEEGGPGSAIWRSQDGGDSWAILEGGLPSGKLGRIGLDVFAGDGKTVYAAIENCNPRGPQKPAEAQKPETKDAAADPLADVPAEVLADPVARADLERKAAEAPQGRSRRSRQREVGGEIYRSDDGGETWAKTHEQGSIGGSPGYYYGQIRVDPSDRDTLYVLSVPVHKSTDGGKTWSTSRGRGGPRTASFGSGLHVDHHALWIDPDDGQHCLLGNDGGLAISWDGGVRWDHLPYHPILQCYTVAVDRASPYRIYIGLQDNGTWGFPIHGATTSGILAGDAYKISGGDGFFICIDPTDPDVVYSESQFGSIGRVDLRTGARASIKPRAKKGQQALRFNWSTPILISPHASDTVYVGSQHLHRSRDRGGNWAVISPDLSTNDADKKKGDVPHCTITTISESPSREGLLWVGTDDGKVWRSPNGGARWQDLTERFGEQVRSLWVSRIEASAHDPNVAYVSFTGYREDVRKPFLYRTDDGGETWMDIAHQLPDEPINVVREHPRAAHVLFVGTEMGAYVSVDHGANWYPFGSGLPRTAVHDLVVHPQEPHVLIGTHGRGVFAIDASALEQLTAAMLTRGSHALPPSGGVMLPRRKDQGYQGARGWSTPNPFVTPTFRYLLGEQTEQAITIEVKDITGAVLFTREGSKEAGYHEVRWAQAGRGRGGFSGMNLRNLTGRGRTRQSGPRPGEFAVTISFGERSTTQRFTVTDRRPPSAVLGRIPGTGDGIEDESEEARNRDY